MTLVKTRAAFEKAVTDAVSDVDPTISMVYDNVTFTTSGKTKKYLLHYKIKEQVQIFMQV